MGLPGSELAHDWRRSLPDPVVVPLDAAGCACPSRAVLAATVRHLHREAEIGGYAAEAEAAATLAGVRAGLGRLVGLGADEVALVPNATVAFTTLFGAWPLRGGARLGVLASEYGSNRMALEELATRRGWSLVELRVDGQARLDLDAFADRLRDGLDLVTFPVVASHRGVVQPAADTVRLARDAGVPVVLDVAQAAGHVPLDAVGADAYVGTARKWLRGPRGTGWLAATGERGRALTPEYPSLAGLGTTGAGRLATTEASIAARVGLGVALDELAAVGSTAVCARVAALGVLARHRLDGLDGWRVHEPLDEPSGIVTLTHPDQDPLTVAGRLLEAGVSTSAIPAVRAPTDLVRAVLRVSLHAYCDADDLDRLEFSLRR